MAAARKSLCRCYSSDSFRVILNMLNNSKITQPAIHWHQPLHSWVSNVKALQMEGNPIMNARRGISLFFQATASYE